MDRKSKPEIPHQEFCLDQGEMEFLQQSEFIITGHVRTILVDLDSPVDADGQQFALSEAQRHYYQTTLGGKGTGEIVEIDWDNLS